MSASGPAKYDYRSPWLDHHLALIVATAQFLKRVRRAVQVHHVGDHGAGLDIAVVEGPHGNLEFARVVDIGVANGRFLQHRHYRREGIGCPAERSEEHTSELQSLMRISYDVFCLKKKKQQQ